MAKNAIVTAIQRTSSILPPQEQKTVAAMRLAYVPITAAVAAGEWATVFDLALTAYCDLD
jgi:hypothetical protein